MLRFRSAHRETTAMILAGDIGGTKTLLQLAEFDMPLRARVLCEHRYDSRAYDDLSPMVHEFVDAASAEVGAVRPTAACFGIAGPVSGETASLTNLTWQLDAGQLGDALSISKVRLINDFHAIGYGIEALGTDDLVTLQPGAAAACAARAVIGAGTGLGEGILVWTDDHYEVLASEGGHVDFAPTDSLQMDLLRYLMDRFGHVSYERVCCGNGLVNIYEFLRDSGVEQESPALAKAMKEGDPAAAISQAALAAEDPMAIQALEMFVRIYGAQAGNLALTCLANGGVYVAGGIAPKIIDKLKEDGFMEAFRNKGRMSRLTREMPVYVVANPKVGLMGAALAANRL